MVQKRRHFYTPCLVCALADTQRPLTQHARLVDNEPGRCKRRSLVSQTRMLMKSVVSSARSRSRSRSQSSSLRSIEARDLKPMQASARDRVDDVARVHYIVCLENKCAGDKTQDVDCCDEAAPSQFF